MILFKNNSNNCYLNAVLQSLININLYVHNLNKYESNTNLIDEIKKLCLNKHNNTNTVDTTYSTNNLKRILSNYNKELFDNNNQQDAHETIINILDIIHTKTVMETNVNIILKDYGIHLIIGFHI